MSNDESNTFTDQELARAIEAKFGHPKRVAKSTSSNPYSLWSWRVADFIDEHELKLTPGERYVVSSAGRAIEAVHVGPDFNANGEPTGKHYLKFHYPDKIRAVCSVTPDRILRKVED